MSCAFCQDKDVATYSVCLQCLQTSPKWTTLNFHQSIHHDVPPMNGGCDYCNHPCREVVYDVDLCDYHVEINDLDENPYYEQIESFVDCLKICMAFPDINKPISLDDICSAIDYDDDNDIDPKKLSGVFIQMGFIHDNVSDTYIFPKNPNCPFWDLELPESIKSVDVEFYSKENFTTKSMNLIPQKLVEICRLIRLSKPDQSYVIDCAVMNDILKLYIGSE